MRSEQAINDAFAHAQKAKLTKEEGKRACTYFANIRIKCFCFQVFRINCLAPLQQKPESKYFVPDWVIQSTLAEGCRTGPPGCKGWRAGTTTLCHRVDYIPQSGTKNLASGSKRE